MEVGVPLFEHEVAGQLVKLHQEGHLAQNQEAGPVVVAHHEEEERASHRR